MKKISIALGFVFFSYFIYALLFCFLYPTKYVWILSYITLFVTLFILSNHFVNKRLFYLLSFTFIYILIITVLSRSFNVFQFIYCLSISLVIHLIKK